MDRDTLLVLAIATTPERLLRLPQVSQRVAALLTADDRATLRNLRDQILPHGIDDAGATLLNQLTGASPPQLGGSGHRIHGWIEGTD